MPGGANITISDRDRGDDDLADDEGDDGLPDGDAGGYEGAAELPVGEGDLVDCPEGDEAVDLVSVVLCCVALVDRRHRCDLRPSSPSPPMRW